MDKKEKGAGNFSAPCPSFIVFKGVFLHGYEGLLCKQLL
jgi:hypothetical protein